MPITDNDFVSMIWVAYQPDPALAAGELVADLIANQSWMRSDCGNVMILFKDFGYGPATDNRTFFRPQDSLPSYPTDDGYGTAYQHPFLRNATTGGEMRTWMTTFRDTLRVQLAGSSFPHSLRNCVLACHTVRRHRDPGCAGEEVFQRPANPFTQ